MQTQSSFSRLADAQVKFSPHIRPAQHDDAEALAQIMCSVEWLAHLRAEPRDSVIAMVQRHLHACAADASHAVYVAETQAQRQTVIGYIVVHWLPYICLPGMEGYISELLVLDTWRGKGAGTRLLDVVIAEAKQRGCARLKLLSGRRSEAYEREFYTQRGWEERDQTATFIYRLKAREQSEG